MWIETGGELVDLSKVVNVYKENGKTSLKFLAQNAAGFWTNYQSEAIRDAEFERIKSLLFNKSSDKSV